MTATLPIFETAIAAYKLIFRRSRRFLALSWLVLLFVAAASVSSLALFGPSWGSAMAGLSVLLAQAVFNVAWHRTVMLDEQPRSALGLDRRSLLYMLATFLLVAITGIMGLTIGLGGVTLAGMVGGEALGGGPFIGIVAGLLLIVILSLIARFSLILPEIALDRGLKLFRSWEITRGNGWRLMVIGIIANLPLAVLSQGLADLVGGLALAGPAALLLGAIDATLQFLMLAVSATVLSLAYMRLAPIRRPAGGSAIPSTA
ncbi:hypothetical protein [Oceanibaculum pacificum]|uniref:Glycerophosphoryl diester phosphodiesterase membrane domain-containing protein n=1 Tax=Oceanibaculum pacificum TaxID=580166 RepID=A0A154VX00_9PROT|nr:hypothetical protein [Oceanibaculum pacificum]KZD05864.1 hypothetical protein AUP43_02835 [Oceanibaculum pacificum]